MVGNSLQFATRSVRTFSKRLLTGWCSGLLTGLFLLADAPPSQAYSCAEVGVSTMDAVFVGEAQELRHGFTKFSVEEVWGGDDLAPTVWVQSAVNADPWPLYYLAELRGSLESGDAEFEVGNSYVVGATSDFETHLCSSYGAEDDSERPAQVRQPISGGLTGARPPLPPWILNVGALLVLVGLIQGVRLLRSDSAEADADLTD